MSISRGTSVVIGEANPPVDREYNPRLERMHISHREKWKGCGECVASLMCCTGEDAIIRCRRCGQAWFEQGRLPIPRACLQRMTVHRVLVTQVLQELCPECTVEMCDPEANVIVPKEFP